MHIYHKLYDIMFVANKYTVVVSLSAMNTDISYIHRMSFVKKILSLGNPTNYIFINISKSILR